MQISHQQIGGLLFLALSVFYGFFVSDITLYAGAQYEPFTAQTLPKILSALGVVISVLLIVLGRSKNQQAIQMTNHRKVLLLLLAMAGYGLVVDWLGFLLATSLFLISGFTIMGETNRLRAVLIACVFSFLFWALLTQALDVYLEPGSLWYFLSDKG